MRALVAAELLKLRTTRAWLGFPLAAAGLAGLAAAATIGASSRSRPGFAADLGAAASAAGVAALTLGIVLVTAEFRHGTVTPAFLVAPRRWTVLLAKSIAALACGAALGLVAAAATLLVAAVWLAAALGEPLPLAALLPPLARVVLATALLAGLGASVGSLVHGQAGGLLAGLIGILVAEPLVAGLASLIGAGAVADYLPGGATAAIAAAAPDSSLPLAAAVAVLLAWIGGVGALGCLRTLRHDLT